MHIGEEAASCMLHPNVARDVKLHLLFEIGFGPR